MAVTLKHMRMKVKDQQSGEYVSLDTLSDGTTAERVAAVNAAGAAQIAAINAAGLSGDIIAPVESSATATAAHGVGELFILNGSLLVALSAIAVGDTITTTGNSPNAAVTMLSSELIRDIQVNGTSIVANGVANVPVMGQNTLGVAKANSYYGVYYDNGAECIVIYPANSYSIKVAATGYQPIVPTKQHESVFYGLAKASGDTTQKDSSNSVGTYTESAKSSISDMLNAPETVSGSTPSITAKPGVRYICGECATLTIVVPATGIIDVVFESGSTATVLTVTPPTGMTMKWIGDDPTALEANKTYEVNIMNGCYGMVVSWT